jgi:hypothetical protein
VAPPSVCGMKKTARRLRVVRPGEVSGTAPRGARSDDPADSPPDSRPGSPSHDPWGGGSPHAATEAYWSRVQALRAALDDLRPVG